MVSRSEQPSTEVAEIVEEFTPADATDKSFGLAQFTLVWMPVVLTAMVPFR